MKRRLIQRFGDNIIISSSRIGRPSVICFRDVGKKIIEDSWYNKRAVNEEEEKFRIVKLAAKIIRDDIRSRAYNVQEYPPADDFLHDATSVVPETLNCFMEGILISIILFIFVYEDWILRH